MASSLFLARARDYGRANRALGKERESKIPAIWRSSAPSLAQANRVEPAFAKASTSAKASVDRPAAKPC